MRRTPWFRWTLLAGLVLIGCWFAVYLVTEPPGTRQTDLIVLHEDDDGACTVRWTDPGSKKWREGPYQCDPKRDGILKAPYYREGYDEGWDTGWVITEGPREGDLHSPPESGGGTPLADGLLVAGLLLTIAATAGTIHARSRPGPKAWFRSRLGSADREVIHQAEGLRDAAALAAADYRAAVAAIRDAWIPLRRDVGPEFRLDALAPGPGRTGLLTSLWVLLEAGPQALEAARTGAALTARLEPLLSDAGSGQERDRDPDTARALRLLTEAASRHGAALALAEASADLLRGHGADPTGLAAEADFAARPSEYESLLRTVVSSGVGSRPRTKTARGEGRRR